MPEYFEDEEWRSQLYKWTSVAAKLDPEEYSYRMGWIYADGLGCDQSYEKVFEFFHQAYSHGDCRGADAIAKIYEVYLEENPDLDESEKKQINDEKVHWKHISESQSSGNTIS